MSSFIHLTLTRESFERIYRSEQDVKTKERICYLFSMLYIRGYGSCSYVARDLHRCKAWACEWLKRYYKEGIEGLKDRTKSGRPSELSEEVSYIIKKELKESNQRAGPQSRLKR